MSDIREALSEYVADDLLDEYMDLTGADIISLLKRHIGPVFIIGVDGRCVILSYKKDMVKIHVDGMRSINLRRGAKLLDKEKTIEVLFRIIVAVGTLDFIITQKEANNVND